MVDGADKIDGLKYSPYNNYELNSDVLGKDTKPLPLVKIKHIESHPFEIETSDPKLKFEIPENAPQNAKDFIQALVNNKKSLMKDLNIDSKTYDMLAQTAVAIAQKETGFGNTKDRVYKAYRELYIRTERFLSTKNSKIRDYSRGMTNLKYTMHINDKSQPQIKELMLKYGIFDEYELNNTDKSAIGTMILLSTFNDRIDRNYSEGFEQSKAKYGATKIDALCALWNGGMSSALVKGELDPKNWTYTQKIHKYIKQYKVIK